MRPNSTTQTDMDTNSNERCNEQKYNQTELDGKEHQIKYKKTGGWMLMQFDNETSIRIFYEMNVWYFLVRLGNCSPILVEL